MGYLDGATITVDAILTKKGREILSKGGALSVKSFTLSDTGVDYTLWNTDHPSGSANYGEAIENLPQVEALPAAQYQLRNKLVTFSKDTISMPVAYLSNTDHTFTTLDSFDFVANITGWAGANSGWHLLIPDTNIARCGNVTGARVSGNALMFIAGQDIANAQLYELTTSTTTSGGALFTIQPAELKEKRTMTLTFIHISTGAWASAQITVQANADTRRRMPKAIRG